MLWPTYAVSPVNKQQQTGKKIKTGRLIKLWCRSCNRVTKFTSGDENICQSCGKQFIRGNT